MAANLDLNRIPGKPGDPYRGQAVLHPGQGPQHKIKLPAIPDFRFESAYLSALRPFVTPLQDSSSTKKPETVTKRLEERGGLVSQVNFDYGIPIQINWPAVLWITLRDQVIVQFVTGSIYATWALFGTPFFKSIRIGLSNFFSPPGSGSSASPLSRLPKPQMTTPGWGTIRPWTNRIAIQVKELTSISATFILSSATAAGPGDGELAGLHAAEHTPQQSQKPVGEILARGFTVKVNNGSWNNYFLGVEEDSSEAVIILHGLRPARDYEVEITLEQEESALRKDFATLDNDTVFMQQSTFDQVHIPDDDLPQLSPEIVPSRELTPPITPESSSPPQSIAIEERAAHLRLRKSSFDAQIRDLDSQLKSERKESQRAENATRAEIENLKKATEKQAATDQRAKQKVLALQEAVKQTLSATTDIEAQAVSIQSELPQLRKEEAVVEAEHGVVTEAANLKDAEVEQALRTDKKRISDLQSELSGLSNRVEKLTTKRDKLLNETVPNLEQQLADIRREMEEAEIEKEQYSHYSLTEDPLLSPLTGFRNPIRPVANTRLMPPLRTTPFAGPPAPQTFSQISAAAAPFYPNRQPGIIHRGQGSRGVNDFRPFDPALSQPDGANTGLPFTGYSQATRRTSMDN